MLRLRVILPSLLFAGSIYAANTAGSTETARSVTITRDNYGVPHITGPTDASCAFGYAYAQAEDNFWQIEDSYIRGLGRASEIYGPATLNDDVVVRTLEIPKFAKAEYDRSSPRMKQIAEAFADGINYYLAHDPKAKPRLLKHFEPWYTYAFGRYALYYSFLYSHSGIKNAEITSAIHDDGQVGSNTWAIAPKKSTSGHAMLFINPHQPFFGVGQWYEGHVKSAEGLNMSGASFFGSAFPTLGHNEFLGWSHTVNEPDVVDVWEETFDNPSDPLSYRYDGGYRKATAWSESILVKTDTGMITRKFTLHKTHHGPIVAARNGKQYSVRFAMLEEGGQMEQWYEMAKSRNYAEFRKAMSRVAVPMFNTSYADRDGNIFYVYNGAVPRRNPKFDWQKPVDGSSKETEWQGYHTLDELPQVFNPKDGFLQNCNSSPFATTSEDNPDPAKFPSYLVGNEIDNPRARISRRILYNKDKFSLDDLAKAGFDTYVIEAESDIPNIISKWIELKKTDAGRAAKLNHVMAMLREWDHIGTIESKPMSVYTLWKWKTARDAAHNTDALVTLETTMAELEKTYGSYEVAWGEVNRLQRNFTSGAEPFSDARPSYPVAGGPGDEGIVFNFYATPAPGQKHRYGIVGHSFVSVIEFAPEVEARSILVFGEDSDPNSKHYVDQTKMYAEKQFKPAWFSAADIKAHTERSYHPGDR